MKVSALFSSSILLSLFTSAAAFGSEDLSAGRTYKLYGQTIPLHNLESVPADEMAGIEGTNQVFREFFKRKYLTSKSSQAPSVTPTLTGTRRGVHPKAHGCIEGTLKVSNSLDKIDQVGIFKTLGKEYRITARFSNGSPHPERPDKAADSRGFGLKVHGVEGDMLLKNAAGAGKEPTQEFTMNSSDAFFSDTASTYNRFMQIALLETNDFGDAAKNFILELFKKFKPGLGARVLHAFTKIQAVKATNPLSVQYFSITAFQHGTGPNAPVVKYSLAPCDGSWVDPIDPENPDYLRINLKKHIEQSPACFKFLVQHRTRSSLSVEDPTRPWKESFAPFREVARIEFPAQNMMDEMACEKEVINPWNTLPEHKPVGGINRLRLAAYLLSIEARKHTNKY